MCIYTHVMASRRGVSREDLKSVATECACRRLRGAARTVTRLYDEALRPTGLRTTQFTLMVAAELHGEAQISQLADTLNLERTTLTRELKVLEDRGLISVTQ